MLVMGLTVERGMAMTERLKARRVATNEKCILIFDFGYDMS
jgi:hypothetical protein